MQARAERERDSAKPQVTGRSHPGTVPKQSGLSDCERKPDAKRKRDSAQPQEGRSHPGTAGPRLKRAFMEFKTIRIQIPDGANIILGQTHFIKTAEDLYEILAGSSPHIKFGLAFTEASGPCLIRHEGNDSDLTKSTVDIVQNIGAGHVFAILMRD